MKTCCYLALLSGILGIGMPLQATPFADGARVALYGDSVTHHGYYVTPVQIFYYTRYPDRDIRIWNCGVGGETAEEAIRRFRRDIVSRKPTDVAILFGMNDVCVVGYQTNAPSWAVSGRKNAPQNFARSMNTLKDMFARELPQTRLIWCTLVPWDDELKFAKPRGPITGVTAGEKPLSDIVTRIQREVGGGYVDFYAPMVAYNRKMHVHDPFTSLSPDSIHPKEAGGLFMMNLLLKSQGVEGLVSDVQIDAGTPVAVASAQNATVTEVKGDETLSFTLLEKALPFPVYPEARTVADDIGFDAAFNREMLTVSGLKPGNWQLSIDGVAVVAHTAEEWAKGVNLARCETPMMAQARAVAKMTESRRQKECVVRSMLVGRCVALRRMMWKFKMSPDEYADDRFALAFAAGYARAYSENGIKNPRDKNIIEFNESWHKASALENEIESLHCKIRTINRPTSHHFVFSRCK